MKFDTRTDGERITFYTGVSGEWITTDTIINVGDYQ